LSPEDIASFARALYFSNNFSALCVCLKLFLIGMLENGYMQVRPRSISFSIIPIRNNFRQTQSAEKLFEKYNALAKEAMSSGDKTLVENYLQHADHFVRIIEDKNKNQNQSKVSLVDIPVKNNENLSDSEDINKNSESKKKD
jgi:hypothetical protein